LFLRKRLRSEWAGFFSLQWKRYFSDRYSTSLCAACATNDETIENVVALQKSIRYSSDWIRCPIRCCSEDFHYLRFLLRWFYLDVVVVAAAVAVVVSRCSSFRLRPLPLFWSSIESIHFCPNKSSLDRGCRVS